jgi:methionyl-tRNA formyltransferase
MTLNKNLIAIGRSRYLYDGIRHLHKKGFLFKAIITEEAYDEYDIKHDDFRSLSLEIGASFFMTKSLNNQEILTIIESNNIKAAISANWKYTIQPAILDLFEYGILNFHLGNLPDYKGNATVNWSIINGESFINGNIHKMDPILDAGDIISRKQIPIKSHTYISDILKQAEEDAPGLYEEAIEQLQLNPGYFLEKGTTKGLRCYPRLPEDSQINWETDAEAVSRLVRASSHPYKGAYTYLNGEKIIVWKSEIYKTNERFLAIPGHIIQINKDENTILVACKSGIQEIQLIEYGGKVVPPTTLCKSIRERFKYIYNA